MLHFCLVFFVYFKDRFAVSQADLYENIRNKRVVIFLCEDMGNTGYRAGKAIFFSRRKQGGLFGNLF